MNNVKITKQNGNICFEEGSHKYWDITDPNKKFISVTTIIEKFGQPFDKEFWSAYKALEKLLPEDSFKIEKKGLLSSKKFDESILKAHDIDENDFNREQQSILDSWEEENKKSCERGTKIHANFENSFYKKKKNIDITKFQIGGTFECRKDYTDLDLENAVYPEYLIHRVTPDGKLCLAGQIDLLVKKGNNIIIGDFKGLPLNTKIPTASGWSTMKDLKVGDLIYDEDGKLCSVLHKSQIHNNPCFKIYFDDNTSIIADHEHRWLVYIDSSPVVKNTEELYTLYTKSNIRIKNMKPIIGEYSNTSINPYKFGTSFIKNSKKCTNSEYNAILKEIKEFDTSDLTTIPIELQRASYNIRLYVLKGIMDMSGYIDDGFYVIEADNLSQVKELIKFLSTFGFKLYIKDTIIKFKTNSIYPFNARKIDSTKVTSDSYRTIIKIEPVDTIPTQCIEVSSPSHTYVFSENFIVTHNTNKKIDIKSFYDSKTRSSVKMKYPLNNLDDTNYWHYCLQLSTYAWMIQKVNPNFNIEDLVLIHIDHKDKMTIYHLPYLKTEVEKMLAFYKKQLQLEENASKRKRIEY